MEATLEQQEITSENGSKTFEAEFQIRNFVTGFLAEQVGMLEYSRGVPVRNC
jgi:hypothetical protein